MIKNLLIVNSEVKKYLFLFFYLLLLLTSTGWFELKKELPLDLDELAWIQDSQVFKWRLNNNQENFSWSDEKTNWRDKDFRLFDQPHFVKYIHGFAFSVKGIEPWSNQEKNYLQFVQQSLGGEKTLYQKDSENIFGKTTIEAIVLARKISSFFGILFIFLISTFLTNKFSLIEALITSFFIISNPIFRLNLNLATADSISMFFILLTIIIFYMSFKKSSYRKFFIITSAITAAIAASSKVNGWLLPISYILLTTLNLLTEKNKIKLIKETSLWFSLYCGIYFYLQPELWQQPIAGLQKYFYQRVVQQLRFEINSQNLNIFSYHYWLSSLVLESITKFTYSIKIIILAVISLDIFKKIILTKTISLDKLKQKVAKFINNNYKIYLIFTLIWFFIFLYAKIGFERYAMWPLVVVFIVVSNFIEKITNNFLIRK